MNAYEIENAVMLTFTKVLSEVQQGAEEDDVSEVTGRSYWLSRGIPATMKAVAQGYELKYNKFYSDMAENGNADNFVILGAFKSFARKARSH